MTEKTATMKIKAIGTLISLDKGIQSVLDGYQTILDQGGTPLDSIHIQTVDGAGAILLIATVETSEARGVAVASPPLPEPEIMQAQPPSAAQTA